MKNYYFKIFLNLIFIFISNCSSTNNVEYNKTDMIEGSVEWGPKEIHLTVETMVDSMDLFIHSSKKKPFIELIKIQNKSSEHIDTSLLSNELSTELIKRKITFVDRSTRKESLLEISNAQKGLIDEKSQIEAGKLISPNFLLTGDVTDNVRYENGEKKQYIIITLRLISLETGAVEWQENKKFYKISSIQRVGF
jgi:penicillin-binding protein activator